MRGTMTPQRSGAPLEPGPSSLALSPTNLKSIVGQCRGRGPGLERGRKGEKPTAAILVGQPRQVVVPVESRADVSGHGFWNQGTNAMFDVRIVNLDAGSYLRMTPEKDLAKAEKKKKVLYLQACLERIRTFTPMVYYADGIPGAEALAAQKRLAALLS